MKKQKEKADTLARETTIMTDGITECCGYDFGEAAFAKKKPRYCPMCGKKIVRIE